MEHEIEHPPIDSDLVISILEKVGAAVREDYAVRFPGKLSIYRVPPNLREQSESGAYTPQFVSLGPYHHDSPRLLQMERHKWRALLCILCRNNQKIDIYVDSMKQLEYEARACYEGELDFTSNQFIEMMLFDGCFILEILRGSFHGFETLGYGKNDPIFSSQGIATHSIELDMLMLENQIPIIVLVELFRLESRYPQGEMGLVIDLAIAFFGLYRSPYAAVPLLDHQDSHHFLDLIRTRHCCGGPEEDASNRTHPALLHHCVTELIMDAGINIKLRETDMILDIKFHDGTLYIPWIMIDDGTKSLLGNLIAFEQCHHCKKVITSYFLFLDGLIHTAADVRCLSNYGIIKHGLGSDEEVANFFNCLGKEVVVDLNDNGFNDLSRRINRYYRQKRKWYAWVRKWNSWLADLKNRYFKNPWTILSLLAGFLILLFTGVQAFYEVYSYYLPNN